MSSRCRPIAAVVAVVLAALVLGAGCTGGAAPDDDGQTEPAAAASPSAEDVAYLDEAAVLIGHTVEVAEHLYGFGAFEPLTPLALEVRDAQSEQLEAVEALRAEAGLPSPPADPEDVDPPSGDAFEALTDSAERDTLVLEDLRVRLARVVEVSQRYLAEVAREGDADVRERAAAIEDQARAHLADVDAELIERGSDPPPPPGS